jgi:hypothetical protein
MSPFLLFGLQFTLSLVIFALIAMWYITPALDRLPIHAALVPLFLVHTLRYLPSTAFAPGQVDPKLPMDAMATIAYGDLASAILALVAVVFLRFRWAGSIAVAWLVNVLASLDWLNAGFVAASRQFPTYALGGNWYIVNYYVPVIGVVHVMIFQQLLKARARAA